MATKIIVFLSVAILSSACSVAERTSGAPSAASPTPFPSPKYDVNSSRPKDTPLLRAVKPALELTSKQRKYLDESIPAKVRKVLENSDRFELLGEFDKEESHESDNRSFNPNRLVVIGSDDEKRRILEAFYFDASREDSAAICYEPHHAIKASHLNETVEIEICFDCSRFFARYGPEEYSGTIVREGRRSEDLFEKIFNVQK